MSPRLAALTHFTENSPELTLLDEKAPMDRLQPPTLTLKQLGDDQDSAKLLRQSGLL